MNISQRQAVRICLSALPGRRARKVKAETITTIPMGTHELVRAYPIPFDRVRAHLRISQEPQQAISLCVDVPQDEIVNILHDL